MYSDQEIGYSHSDIVTGNFTGAILASIVTATGGHFTTWGLGPGRIFYEQTTHVAGYSTHPATCFSMLQDGLGILRHGIFCESYTDTCFCFALR